MRTALCAVFVLLIVSCGRINRPNPTPVPVTVVVTATPAPTPHPAASTPLPTTDTNAIAVELINGTPWSISVDAGGIVFDAELHAGGGALTVDETGIGSTGGLMRVERLQVRPITANTPNDPTYLHPVLTSTAVRPNTVDNPMCDVTYSAAYLKGQLCRQFKSFTIDTRCLNEYELAIALDEAGWPTDALEAAVLEFQQESNGCINAIDGLAVGIAGIHWVGHTITGWDRGTPRYPEFADQNPYNVIVNLRLALRIWRDSGWGPWRGGNAPTPTIAATHTIAPTPLRTLRPTIVPTLPSTPLPTAAPTATFSPTATATVVASVTPDCFIPDATMPGSQTGVLNESCQVQLETGCDAVEKIATGWRCISWRGRSVPDVSLSAQDFALLPGARDIPDDHIAEFVRACSCATGCRLGWISGTARERGPWGVNTHWLTNQGVSVGDVNMFEPNNAIALAWRMYEADGGFFRWPASCVNE